MALPTLPAGAVDAGVLPGTQVVTLTLYLAPSADRTSALDAFLTALRTPGSTQYHRWATPASFAQSFGATADQIATIQTWAEQQGLSVGTGSASGIAVTVTGTAAQVEAALAPGLHAMQMNGQRYLTNTAIPTLPGAVAANVLAIDGLDTVPAARLATLRRETGRLAVSDLLSGVSAAVEANNSRIMSIDSPFCVGDVDPSAAAAMHLLIKEAAAEGITTLASSGCKGRMSGAGSASYPGGLAELVSVAAAPGITPAASPELTEARPGWQDAPGLPQDEFRYEPDLTVSSLADLESTVLAILARQPAQADGRAARLGNIAGTLYEMAPDAGVYAQPDGAAPGTWEAPTGLGVADLAALAKHFPDGSATSQVSIMPSGGVYSITYLGDESYTITVSGSSGTPTGSVTVSFSPGGYSKTVALSGGTATFSLDQLGTQPAAGQSGTEYTLTATYSGDSTYAQMTGATNLFVNPQAITTSASATATGSSLVVGGTYTVTVTLSGATGSPTGTLTITPTPPGSSAAQSPSFTGTSNVTATFTATQAGNVSIAVMCGVASQSSYLCYNSSTSTYVNKATPTVSAVTVSPNPATVGQQVTLSATVTGAGGSTVLPSGTVSFKDASGTALCTTSSSSAISGSVSCTTSTLTAATSGTVTATYNGDSNYNTASATGSYSSAQVGTTVALTASKQGIVVGGQVTLTAVVTPAQTLNNTPLSGTVTFYDAAGQLGAPQTLTAYYPTVVYAVTLPTQGAQTIYAKYSGDTNYSGNTSNNVSVLVGPATSVSFAANPTGNVTYGVPVVLTATVTGTPTDGSNALSGTVTFNIYGTTTTTVANIALSSTSATTATATTTLNTPLAAGTYKVQLSCTNSNFDCSSLQNSGSYNFNITPETPTVNVTLSPNTTAGGATVTATATITPAASSTESGLQITGTVTFYDNGINKGMFGVTNNSTATSSAFTLSSAGGDTIVAVYSGDANNNSANGTYGTTTVSTGPPTNTTISVSASPLTALSGAVVTLTATVTTVPTSGSTSSPNASGMVYFYVNNANGTSLRLGPATLAASGTNTSTATYPTTALPDGTNVISAAFVANSSYNASASTTNVTVQTTDYNVQFDPKTVSTTAGGSPSTVTAAVNSYNGFTGKVVLGCTPPAGSAITCSFNPTVVNTSGFSTLTITTTARSAVVVSHPVEAEAGAAGAFLLCLLIPAVRRRRLRVLAVAVLTVLGSTLGCTNIVNGPTGSGLGSGTPAGTLVLSITTSGTDGVTTVQHNYTIPVSVQ